MAMMQPRLAGPVAVIGGGASGVLAATHLLRALGDDAPDVALYEAGEHVGNGVAYATSDVRHLLNVRAHGMSAFPDAPAHFTEWLGRRGYDATPERFVPRMVYARYLREVLADAAEGVFGPALLPIREYVRDVRRADDQWEVVTDRAVRPAAGVVLAYGNSRPRALRIGENVLPDAPWHIADPWDTESMRRLPDDAHVVLVGSGLTAVDAAVTLLDDRCDRTVTMASRGGALPAAHTDELHTAWAVTPPRGRLTADGIAEFVREQVRDAADRGVDWRAVVDGMRWSVQDVWSRLPDTERRRFLTRYAREWQVSRHRMAPGIAERIRTWRSQGRLSVRATRLASARERTDGAVEIGFDDGSRAVASAVVNCTGPDPHPARSEHALVRTLVARGTLCADSLGLGVACDPYGRIIDRDGSVVPNLYTIGSPRKGTLFESTAVPEIRVQAAELARTLMEPVTVPTPAQPF